MSDDEKKSQKHRAAMKKQQQRVAESVAKAQIDRGVAILLTGDGKGKSTSAFGMVMRALGYGQKVGIVQFIKGEQLSGEEIYLRDYLPEHLPEHRPQVTLQQMATGFTWDTQDRDSDRQAAEQSWQIAAAMLADPSYDVVVLDELTYMFAYSYLDQQQVIQAIRDRPRQQSVIVTGRGGGSALREVMDTISEIKDIKHAYTSGIRARIGIDY